MSLAVNTAASGQEIESHSSYPIGYFRNPLDIPIVLAGNFGECRPNHFHSGIDIKTNGKENLPVYAAAEGYISRIKMERGGFGHALYVTHPNGYTTVYAHLNKFMPEVQRYMTDEQYKKESWEVDISLESDRFPVRKGQQIAWSGNTGASTAPHLHFEMRDTKTEHPLNPQLFGFDINDDIAPKPTQIAVYNSGMGIYSQSPKLYDLVKKGDDYTISDTVVLNFEKAGVGIVVNDYMNGSSNTLTYYTAAMYMDDEAVIKITLDDIGYDVTRYLHAFVDYKTRKLSSKWVQLLFQMPGNKLDNIYRTSADRGTVKPGAGARHMRIALKDANGNKSEVSFYMKAAEGGNTVMLTCEDGALFSVSQANNYSTPTMELNLKENALYENVCFTVRTTYDEQSYSARHQISEDYIPVHSYFDLRIKPDKAIPFEWRDKIAMVYADGKTETGKGAIPDNGWYKASVRNFGEYHLVADRTPPLLKALQGNGADLSKANQIRFQATDAVTSVKKFRAELDGKWLCFEQAGSTFTYVFDEHCPKGKHTLLVTAADENNNVSTLKYTFTR